MIASDILETPATTPSGVASGRSSAGTPDDKDMSRAAVDLTRDIATARPGIYWPDMSASATSGYAASAGAISSASPWAASACGVLASSALYRASSFIHESTHIHKNASPGFRSVWNSSVGIPMSTPSFMYEGVHTSHHARTRYGTAEDPEYSPSASMKPWSSPVFSISAISSPSASSIRSGISVPSGVVIPPLRTSVWERASASAINPAFRRRPPEGDFARMVFWQESGASAWAIFSLGWSATHGWRPSAIGSAVISATAVLNQIRTL
ncbi:hypothetical protein OY671_007616, partial [Metschnikowia pulcherrima]